MFALRGWVLLRGEVEVHGRQQDMIRNVNQKR